MSGFVCIETLELWELVNRYTEISNQELARIIEMSDLVRKMEALLTQSNLRNIPNLRDYVSGKTPQILKVAQTFDHTEMEKIWKVAQEILDGLPK